MIIFVEFTVLLNQIHVLQLSKTKVYYILLLHNSQNYCKDVSKFVHDAKEKWIFSEIPHSISSMNITCNIMQDLFEGVCRYDFAKIIRHFVTDNFFTIEHLNERNKYFNKSALWSKLDFCANVFLHFSSSTCALIKFLVLKQS